VGVADRVDRRRLAGTGAIAAALDGETPVRLILVRKEAGGAELEALLGRATAAGVAVRRVSGHRFERLRARDASADALALLGDAPGMSLPELMAAGGAVWLLSGVAYPGNAGFVIRTAEVSGARGVVIDAGFDHAGRREAVRASMRADRFLPVRWEESETAITTARACGRRVIAIEDVGDAAPWEVDLSGPVLFVAGGEACGIPDRILAACDRCVRLPMDGFLPSYNVQAAVAVVAIERMRQLEGGP
jgi:tRNA G18 (ribose-2'-O)-methylase SpoU